ncbi:transposase [Siminovitchia fortis]|uniref:transposase n=1 Tax=Siminovitchia fortis TaxID=254758 RepID=UPI0011A1F9FF|nr:transposase [Siminovitchia fortis]WHY81797.1 transposase [Siminovitchia fortis]
MLDHDRLFKLLIETFFEEFIMLFLPDAFEAIDFSDITFLNQEIFTDLMEGEKKVVDLLVKTRLRGEDSIILIHVEPQSYYQENFNERMFIYHNRLYEKHRLPILPVALFTYDENKIEPDEFVIQFPFKKIVSFKYVTIELKKLPWRQYIQQDNPIAAALLSKMGYTKKEKVKVKKEFLRMLLRLQLDPARMQMLTSFFETYLKLDEKEQLILMEEIQMMEPKEEAELMELITSWEKKGREEGEKQEKIKIAKNMLKKGTDEAFIIEVTGLSKEELEEIKKA